MCSVAPWSTAYVESCRHQADRHPKPTAAGLGPAGLRVEGNCRNTASVYVEPTCPVNNVGVRGDNTTQ